MTQNASSVPKSVPAEKTRPKIVSFIGLRRSGKTTIAQLVAKKLNLPFFDTDQIFAQQYNTTVDAFVNSTKVPNWEGFRRVENGIIMDLYAQIKDGVVGLGGGAVAHEFPYYRNLNITTIRAAGPVVYLRPYPSDEESARILAERELKDPSNPNRPPLGQEDPNAKSVHEKTLKLLQQRHPFYQLASNGLVVYEYEVDGSYDEALARRADEVIMTVTLLLRRRA